MYIDTHCHLSDEKLIDRSFEIINNFKNDNLLCIINASFDGNSVKQNLELSKNNNVFLIAGIHPSEAKTYKQSDLDLIETAYTQNTKVLGIGEIGLDYFYGKVDKLEQIELFKKQLDIASMLNAPVCLHIRDAYLDAFDILKEYKNKLPKILFHCYSGSREYLNELIKEFGDKVYFAFGGTSTFKNAKTVVESIECCPLDKIVCETDSPYLTPVPFRGQCVNEPKFVGLVYKKVAEIKNIDECELEQIIYNNVKNFFGRRFDA